MTLDDFLIDKRTVERHIKEGRLSASDYQRALAGLPDRSDNVLRVTDARALAPTAGDGAAATSAADETRTPSSRPEPAIALDAPPV
jgi:hypothetical protein